MKYVFWSGGFDSTYLIISLLKQSETVQPIHIVRPNYPQAQEAVDAIQPLLKTRFGELLIDELYWDPRNHTSDPAFQAQEASGFGLGIGRILTWIQCYRAMNGAPEVLVGCNASDAYIDSPVWNNFFSDIIVPLRSVTKQEMWDNSTDEDREALLKTWCLIKIRNPRYVTRGVRVE